MRIGIGQIIILLLISFLLFGDLKKIKKKLTIIFKNVNNAFDDKKNRKKGT